MAVNADEIYSIAELAEASGFGETYLRSVIKDGDLPARPFGKRMIKVKGKDFLAWFDAQPLKTENTASSKEGSATDGRLSGPAQRDIRTGALTSALR